MAKKEKMPLKRSEDFSQVDDALSEAMDVLDATNARVSELLQSDTESLPDTSAGGAGGPWPRSGAVTVGFRRLTRNCGTPAPADTPAYG